MQTPMPALATDESRVCPDIRSTGAPRRIVGYQQLRHHQEAPQPQLSASYGNPAPIAFTNTKLTQACNAETNVSFYEGVPHIRCF